MHDLYKDDLIIIDKSLTDLFGPRAHGSRLASNH